ncbi:hypothetical protein NX722_21165 [Endozoicomonas gorgoniicola]|uniref:Uracil-DNA glycosylase-like domain-containing protein n=1 Tax=Endozoicomonas gorgoniicola TaxID=1234144 RepID=A0ABT3N0D8_9GAMM|nr:hypothetical protein [Endozoicomonas gorgoniicola]MCW7555086.1 hypothetical protein [Endozoicomonas gorgoniicola]
MQNNKTIAPTLNNFVNAVKNYEPAGSNLPESLELYNDGQIATFYAPFEYINTKARVVICGITPGFQQADLALATARDALKNGATPEEASKLAKNTASFAGVMRSNLVAMLDDIGVNELLSLRSCSGLFGDAAGDVHYTSALRYPVFYRGKNYSGAPSMVRTPALRYQLDHFLTEECQALSKALWIPLGPKVAEALEYISKQGVISPDQILTGLPHPSGANAERISIFLGRKAPEAASAKTNPQVLLDAKERLLKKVVNLAA